MSAPNKNLSDVPVLDLDAPLKVEKSENKEEIPSIEKNGRYLYISSIFFGVIVFSAAAFLYYVASNNSKNISSQTTIVSVEKDTSSDTINKDEWPIEVLNGSKTAGVAKKTGDKLTNNGFRVIKVGNSTKKDYVGISIFIQSDLSSKASNFLKEIQLIFPEATISGNLTNSTASARIIVGL
jgi:hypothetical protein